MKKVKERGRQIDLKGVRERERGRKSKKERES
jgi:hypothetical protein